MAREGGYGKSTKAEWLKTDRHSYGEAIQSSAAMGQTLETWLYDAIAFHAYHCECLRLQDQFVRDYDAATSPSMIDREKYRPARARPVMSQPEAGKGTGPATAPRGPR